MSELDALLRISHQSAHERLSDRLTDALFAVDEALQMLKADDAFGLLWVEAHLRNAYVEIDSVVERMSN